MLGRYVCVVAAMAAVSCSSEDTSSRSSNASGESSPTEPTSLRDLTPYSETEVQALMSHVCTECHYAGSIHDMDLSHFAKATIGVAPRAGGACGKSSFEFRIAPGDRNRSLLWAKVKGTQDCGGKMPGRGAALDDTEIERLGLYIDSLVTATQ